MVNDSNPYQAPEAPIFEDFIAVEPIRPPTAIFVAAAVCVGCAVFLLAILGLLTCIGPARPISKRDLIFMPMAASSTAFLLAAISFWRRRDSRGVILFLAGLGLFASIFLVGSLVS